MNSVCVLLIAFAFAFQSVAGAGTVVAAYAGTSDGSNDWTPIVTSPACAAGTTAGVKWEKFGFTAAVRGVYQVRCMYEQVWRTTGRALIYSGAVASWAPTAACTGFVHEVIDNLGAEGGPKRNDGVLLSAGDYTVVITGDSDTSKGLFACEILQSEINGNNTNSNLYINPVSNEQDSTCSSDSTVVQASAISWTQATTGLYDLNVYFSNTTFDTTTTFGANAILYRGNIIASMNESVNDPCAAKFSAAYIISGQIAGKFVAILQNVSLTATNVYTIVFAGDRPSALGAWGFSVEPTIVRSNAASLGTWTQPDRSAEPSACVDSSYTNQYFYAYTFVAQYPTYIFDTQRTPWDSSSFDTFSFLYSGINNATVPATCSAPGVALLYYGDTGDIRPLAFLGLNVGQYYTVIVSSYSSSSSRGSFGIYAMTGSQIGVVPTGTATSTTGSDGATIGVSFLLLLIAAIFTF